MPRASRKKQLLAQHVARLGQCRRCPRMFPPPVSGGAVVSKVMLVGQAPGLKEPVLGKPFAWTAGRTLFGWFQQFCGMNEEEVPRRFISPPFVVASPEKRRPAAIAFPRRMKFGIARPG